jgi:hypothetical protein
MRAEIIHMWDFSSGKWVKTDPHIIVELIIAISYEKSTEKEHFPAINNVMVHWFWSFVHLGRF